MKNGGVNALCCVPEEEVNEFIIELEDPKPNMTGGGTAEPPPGCLRDWDSMSGTCTATHINVSKGTLDWGTHGSECLHLHITTLIVALVLASRERVQVVNFLFFHVGHRLKRVLMIFQSVELF